MDRTFTIKVGEDKVRLLIYEMDISNQYMSEAMDDQGRAIIGIHINCTAKIAFFRDIKPVSMFTKDIQSGLEFISDKLVAYTVFQMNTIGLRSSDFLFYHISSLLRHHLPFYAFRFGSVAFYYGRACQKLPIIQHLKSKPGFSEFLLFS